MSINPQQVFETTWWEKCGETPWEPTDGGGRKKSTIFMCVETGVRKLAKELPVGALYAADRSHCKGPNGYPRAGADGLAIVCVGIDHHWYIEGRASNCTKPEDNDHRCWVRHGTVGEKLTVDKAGLTCGAGAGSFFMGPNNEWHGFLRNGKLTP
jgi:hypothetical protein